MNIRLRTFLFISLAFVLVHCDQWKVVPLDDISKLVSETPSIEGKPEYLSSPFVTAGDRLYMVGHQDGAFPEIGWHIKGEMGGIWDHPIKLMDGFEAVLSIDDQSQSLDKANSFVNYPYANQHVYQQPLAGIDAERWQFVPDGKEGIVIQYVLRNTSDTDKKIDFTFIGHSDLRPTWLGEKTDMIDSQDIMTYSNDFGGWLAKDQNNTWFVAFAGDRKTAEHSEEENDYGGLGASASALYHLNIPAGETEAINFVIAGSYESRKSAITTLEELRAYAKDLLLAKKARYNSIASLSKLTVPDKKLEETFEWLKYNCDWLIRDVPEIGRGITAGIPDYPWWFGVDSEYALKGYMAIGQQEVVYQTIDLLDSVSNAVNGNGRIIHEMSTNGEVFNPGNINETPQFASLIWEVYQWNGDRAFLEKYFPTIKKGLKWLFEVNDSDQNLFPDGFGMMEIHGLNSEMIDVASYTQRALQDAGHIALELGENDLAEEYQAKANLLKNKINEEFWSEEFHSFADFIGSKEQALHLIEDAIVRADTLDKPWAVEELKNTREKVKNSQSNLAKPFVLHHNWVVNTPMEMKIADESKALSALQTAEKFANPFGMFVTGIDRDASAGSDEGSFKGSKIFSYTGAVMTLPTGVQAVAENNYGRPDKALNYLQKMTRTFSYALPGSMYEVSPDYGMITQAWNIYSFAVPIVQQFFGIQPRAAKKEIEINLQMPSEWDQASLEKVLVDDNYISVYYEKSSDQVKVRVVQTHPDWTVKVIGLEGSETDYQVENGELKQENEELTITSKGGELQFIRSTQ